MVEMLHIPLYFWLFLGLALVVVEFLIPSFFIIFFGVGAWITALVVGLFPQTPLWAMLIVFITASLLLLFLLRAKFAPLFKGDEKEESESEYCGSLAVVTEMIPAHGRGKIKMSGSFWSATADDDIGVGTEVTIISPIPKEPLSFIVIKK